MWDITDTHDMWEGGKNAISKKINSKANELGIS